MSPPFRQGRGTQRMRSFRGSYGNRGSGADLRSSDEVPVVGLDLPCGAGHLGLRCAPGTSLSALGFESRLIKMQKEGPKRTLLLHGAGGGTRTHTMSPSADFESATSTIPSHRRTVAKYISFRKRIQVFPYLHVKMTSKEWPDQENTRSCEIQIAGGLRTVTIIMNIINRMVTK